MAAPVPPGAHRPSNGSNNPLHPPPPNYNPNSNPNLLADNFGNLNLNRPPSMPNSAPRPSSFGQPPHFPSSSPPHGVPVASSPFSRPGPPPGVLARPAAPPSGPPQSALPPNVAPVRPTGPPIGQPSPFGSRAPPGSFPSAVGSNVPPTSMAPPPGAFPSSSLPSRPVVSAPPPGTRPITTSSPLTSAPAFPHSSAPSGYMSNGPPAFASGPLPGGPRFPPAGSVQQPPVGPPSTLGLAGATPQAPSMRSFLGNQAVFAPSVPPVQPAPPFSASAQSVLPPPGSYGTPTPAWQMQPGQVGPPPPIHGSVQPPRMFGMPPPPLPNQSMTTIPTMGQSGAPVSGTSKIDPNQIPRPIPSSSAIVYETRQGNQANPPPPATSDYIVRDTGNCSPRYMRCTISQIPCTADLLTTSGMQLALLIQPLALPHLSEEPVQVVDFGEMGPVRCSRCKAYINPFMKFIDQGRRFICNICGYSDETPRDYHCNLGPDGRRRDADERPELCRGTVEFVATKEYMVREPMPAVYFFLMDVSMNAIQTGATAAACSAISQVISDLPEGPRTMVGIATFDSTIHFYNLKRALQQRLGYYLMHPTAREEENPTTVMLEDIIDGGASIVEDLCVSYSVFACVQGPLMLIVPDVQDVYTPLHTDVVVPLSECRQHLELLLESIPTMFQNNRTAESAFCAAVQAAFLAIKSTGGKLLVFQSAVAFGTKATIGDMCIIITYNDAIACPSTAKSMGNFDAIDIEKIINGSTGQILPSTGIGSLSAREAEGRTNISAGEKEAHKLLQPADKTLRTMAIEFAEYQVCVDVFITTQTYVDIASISVIPRTTGGQCIGCFMMELQMPFPIFQVYYYYPFSALSDPAKLYNDLRWNVTRPQGFEAVMRVRCSQGIQVQEYHGNFCKRIPTDVDLSGIDCDKTIMVTLKHDDKLPDGSECSFQCALLYTTVYGQRRIRVTTLSLPCTSMLSNLFRSADLDTQFACLLKQAANKIASSPLLQVREQVTNLCVSVLLSYRKFCATVTSSGQLILPEALKLLPLYTLALMKSIGLRNDGRIDDRSLWINCVTYLSTPLAIPLVYPRMLAIHELKPKDEDESLVPPVIPLSSEHVNEEGIYLLENGEDCLMYIGNCVDTNLLQQLFGISSADAIPTQFVLQQHDNPLSRKLNDLVNEIRRQRCSYLRLKLCKKGDPSDLDSLPGILQKKYALLRDLDKSLQDIQRQNEQRCEQEIEEIRRGVRSGNITPNTSLIRFSDDALDEQKHSIRIADEKVALAVQAYDLVDTHIQQLDQYLKRFDEELRREREGATASGVPSPSLAVSVKAGRGSESGRGGHLPVDPNEPTYCFCNQVSYGEMVACDNADCKIEWFHFGCVGLKEQPKGKWYCSDCAVIKNRRKGR
ncbi:hypothetical protein CJ030_MR3G026100 [Morella rubra]|uniref:PHD finger protein ING n=1 Tax=Morella rubra TaxID=262757 RepID=A0A6A1W623_9ROSI|nr:hypothetical protein CJ030_MR3G026100 [Morella rubra]